ncbi:MAG: hypothetical protein WD696_06315 [Bryobacteraceae bacterium]
MSPGFYLTAGSPFWFKAGFARAPHLVLAALFLAVPGDARQDQVTCGTNREKWKEERHLHREARYARNLRLLQFGEPIPTRTQTRDAGNLVIMEDSDGVIARRNIFNLNQKTIVFSPQSAAAASYRFQVSENTYDAGLASSGAPLSGMRDDDFRLVQLPFGFPYYGTTHREVYVNSDGNLTFGAGDRSTSERSLGRIAVGAPRVAGLFRDLDPSRTSEGVRVLSEPTRVVVSWVEVPEFQDFTSGRTQTFQIRLFPDGRIEFAYETIRTEEAVVAIAPGGLRGSGAVVSFLSGSASEYASTIAERFGGLNEVDVTTAAQKFFEAHDDAYDFLIFYNNLAIQASSGAVAFEITLRNNRTGYGDNIVDIGAEFGSPRRLQAIVNMGPLSQYPRDINAVVPQRRAAGDTPMSVLAHEAGHLFLAYASVRNPNDPGARPMLGVQGAHWSFSFNSEASILEGNRIRDNGPGVSPRFTTVATVEAFSPLDQYLMGLRPLEEVPPTFLVTGPGASAVRSPEVGVNIDGERRDIAIQEIIGAEGRRTPDHTVAQRRFRFAFVLIVAEGSTPSQDELDQMETYRREFEGYFRRVTSDRAVADTALRRSLHLSAFPAAGLVAGRETSVTITIQNPSPVPLTVLLRSQTGNASVPSSVTLPVGETTAGFSISGVRGGVDEITAEPADSQYDSAVARFQIAPAVTDLRVVAVSGDRQRSTGNAPLPQPLVFRITDHNELPYPGLRVQATASAGGSVTPATATSDENGRVSFLWTPGTASNPVLRAGIEGASIPAGALVSTLGPPALASAQSVVNAASFVSGLSPGGLSTLFGTNLAAGSTAQSRLPWPDSLAGVNVFIGGRAVPLLYVSDTQINFLVPSDIPEGNTEMRISTPAGISEPVQVPVRRILPGIFFDPVTSFGAVLNAGTALTTVQRPAQRGGYIEIYATGLGPVRPSAIEGLQETVASPQVFVGSAPARVVFSGLAFGYQGLYQVNVQIPDNVAPGEQTLTLSVGGVAGNAVKIGVR